MGAGALLLLLSLVQMGANSSRGRVTESRSVRDPGTGESVTRNETRDL